MWRTHLAFLFAASFGIASERDAIQAWHRQSCFTWSKKSGLGIDTIERLWLAANYGEPPSRMGPYIETIDAHSLRHRNQVLFVLAAGNGHCLQLSVFGDNGRSTKPVWQLDQLPDGGICHEPLMPYPAAYVAAAGEIVVQIPTAPAWVKPKTFSAAQCTISSPCAEAAIR